MKIVKIKLVDFKKIIAKLSKYKKVSKKLKLQNKAYKKQLELLRRTGIVK